MDTGRYRTSPFRGFFVPAMDQHFAFLILDDGTCRVSSFLLGEMMRGVLGIPLATSRPTFIPLHNVLVLSFDCHVIPRLWVCTHSLAGADKTQYNAHYKPIKYTM